jgi:ATP-dependent Clp protease ATP-binding subunit ClpB
MQPDAAAKFDRFSDDIRHTMRIANREAKRHLQPLIDTPHLLVALVSEQTGLAGAVLRQRGLTTRSTRLAVRRAFRQQWSLHLLAKLPLSPRVEDVVESAVDHAVNEKHDAVGTGGILLAMVRRDRVTNELLQSLAVDRTELEQALGKYLHRFMVEAPGELLHLDATKRPGR